MCDMYYDKEMLEGERLREVVSCFRAAKALENLRRNRERRNRCAYPTSPHAYRLMEGPYVNPKPKTPRPDNPKGQGKRP